VTWLYHQDSGLLRRGGKPFALCYSGHGEGKNNPLLQNVANVGPIPVGAYFIGEPRDSLKTGKHILPLIPADPAQTFGRHDFEMHGDGIEHPGEASHGCIVGLSLAQRILVGNERGTLLVLPPLEVA
jgi:hypothetical protein